MTATTTTEWRCNRCDAIQVCDDRNQPTDWGTLRLHIPALAIDSETFGHVCTVCIGKLRNWWEHG